MLRYTLQLISSCKLVNTRDHPPLHLTAVLIPVFSIFRCTLSFVAITSMNHYPSNYNRLSVREDSATATSSTESQSVHRAACIVCMASQPPPSCESQVVSLSMDSIIMSRLIGQ